MATAIMKQKEVPEMGKLLGLKKTDRYWLVHKNVFESFQNWYKSQSRYRTKEDREKDALLEDATITMPEMAQLLGTTRSSVYTILDNPKYSHFFEFIVIAEKKRITKESFQKFLEGQDRYKLDPSNDYEELAQEQNIALANFRRKKLSQTGIRGSNGNIKYLTFDEASYLAKVSRSMINKWADKGKFIVIKVGSRVRIRPIIGDAKLSEINTRFIERYYQSLLKRRAVINPLNKTSRNEFVSSSTVRDVNKLLRNCFEQAVKWELMEKNPCTHATVPKHKSQLLPMKSIRNFWQKCWQIQRCGCYSIRWRRR